MILVRIWVFVILYLGRFLSVEFLLLFFLNGMFLSNVVSFDSGIYCRDEFGSRVSNVLFLILLLLMLLFLVILIKRIFFFIFLFVGIFRLFLLIFRIFLVILVKRIFGYVSILVLLVIILFRDKIGRVMYFLILV